MDLVLYHHNHTKSNYPDLCSILRKADHHSASEREDIDDTQEVNETPLISLFSKIVLEGNEKVDAVGVDTDGDGELDSYAYDTDGDGEFDEYESDYDDDYDDIDDDYDDDIF